MREIKLTQHTICLADTAGSQYGAPAIWNQVWNSSLILTKCLDSLQQSGARPKRILELGCGRALSGLYAAKLFPEAQVALTDVSEECLESARANAVVNACDNVEATFLNWHSLDPELPNWDLVIAADVLYLERAVKVLPKALQATLAYDGLALIVDPDRCYADDFEDLLIDTGFLVERDTRKRTESDGDLGAEHFLKQADANPQCKKFNVFHIRKRALMH